MRPNWRVARRRVCLYRKAVGLAWYRADRTDQGAKADEKKAKYAAPQMVFGYSD